MSFINEKVYSKEKHSWNKIHYVLTKRHREVRHVLQLFNWLFQGLFDTFIMLMLRLAFAWPHVVGQFVSGSTAAREAADGVAAEMSTSALVGHAFVDIWQHNKANLLTVVFCDSYYIVALNILIASQQFHFYHPEHEYPEAVLLYCHYMIHKVAVNFGLLLTNYFSRCNKCMWNACWKRGDEM